MKSFIYKLVSYTLISLTVAGTNISYGNTISSSTKLDGRPSNIPEDYIATPRGYAHPECIVTIEEGETVKSDGKIAKADGSERSIKGCGYTQYTKYGEEISSSNLEINLNNRAIGGWEASISHQLPRDNGVRKIVGEWTVPHNPRSVGRQTLFLFNSIQTYSPIIIQPVLGFNQDGAVGPQWSIASWAVGPNLCTNGYCKTGNTTVQPGDIVRGTLTRDMPVGIDPQSVKKWLITISVLRNGVETGSQNLNVELPDSNYRSFDEAVYETYDAETCGQISLLDNLSMLNTKFATKELSWRNGPGVGPAKSLIYDHKCGVQTNIDRGWTSEIYYGASN